MTAHRILVAGVGNIFLGDDGFGVEVVKQLSLRALPSEVSVVDFGIRGFDLTYALLKDYQGVILVDATPRGGIPGTLYEIEPTLPDPSGDPRDLIIQTHGMNPQKVLELVRALGGQVRCLRLVGCEPSAVGSDEEMFVGLSEPVAQAVGPAVDLVESMVRQWIEQPHA